LEHADEVHKITVVPRGQAGGYVVMLPKEDRFLMTKNELLDRVTGLLGGRAAEEVIFGEISTGAHNDFEKATSIVRSMITEYGMSERLAPMQFGRSQGQVFLGRDLGHEQNYSDAIAYEIDKEMQEMINDCYSKAKNILLEKRDKLELIAQTLYQKETLDAEEIRQLMEKGKLDKPIDDDSDSDVAVHIQGKEETHESDQTDDSPAEDGDNPEGDQDHKA